MADPAGLVSLGLEAVKALKSYYDKYKAYQTDTEHTRSVLGRLQRSMEAIRPYLIDSHYHLEPTSRTNLERAVQECKSSFDKLCKKLQKVNAEPDSASISSRASATLQRATYPFKQSTLSKLRELAEDAQGALDSALAIVGLDRTKTVNDGVEQLLSTEESKSILSWLPSIDFTAQRSDISRNITPGTGKTFLGSEKFQKWAGGHGDLLYCTGLPGAGKSAMSCIILQELERLNSQEDRSHSCIFYFFCNYKLQASNLLEQFYGSLLCQSILQARMIPPEVKQLKNKCEKNSSKPTASELLGCFRTIITQQATHDEHNFLIVDALDEFASDSDSRRSLLVPLLQLCGPAAGSTGLSIALTSRELPDVSDVIHASELSSQLLELPITASAEDVHLYLGYMLQRLGENVKANTQLCSEICGAIAASADGIFLLARLHMESVNEEAVNPRRARKAIKDLPTGRQALSVRYSEAMERIKSQPKAKRDLAFALLKWVSFAQEQLSADEMRHALALEDYDDDDLNEDFDEETIPDLPSVVSSCAGLVIVGGEAQVIQFAHMTVDEFFQSHSGEYFKTADFDLTRKCIRYLSFRLIVSETPQKQKHHLGSYCARAWGHHARLSDGEAFDCVHSFITKDKFQYAAAVLLGMPNPKLFGFFGDSTYFGREEYEQLFSRGKNVTPLHLSAYFGLERQINNLCHAGHCVDAEMWNGFTPIVWATQGFQPGALKVLARNSDAYYHYNSELNLSPDAELTWPLVIATGLGDEKSVEILLNTFAPDIIAYEMAKALRVANHFAYAGIAKLLLRHRPLRLQQTDLVEGASHAIYNDNDDVFDATCDAGLDLDHFDDEGYFPRDRTFDIDDFDERECRLGERTLMGRVAFLENDEWRELRDRGATIPTGGARWADILLGAVRGENEELTTTMLNACDDPSALRDYTNTSSFFGYLDDWESSSRLDTLLERGASVHALPLPKPVERINKYNEKPLQQCVEQALEYKARAIVDHCTSLNGQQSSKDGVELFMSPIQYVIVMKEHHALEYFLRFQKPYQADRGDFGDLVQLACRSQNLRELRLLLEAGADANAPPGPLGGPALRIVREAISEDAKATGLFRILAKWRLRNSREMEVLLLKHGAKDEVRQDGTEDAAQCEAGASNNLESVTNRLAE